MGAVKDLSHLCVKVYLGHATMADCENCLYFHCYLSYDQNHILSWKKKKKINIYDVFAVKISQRAIMSCRRDQLTQPNFLPTEGHTYILTVYTVFTQKIEKFLIPIYSFQLLLCFAWSSWIFLHYQRKQQPIAWSTTISLLGKKEVRGICAYIVPSDLHSNLFF